MIKYKKLNILIPKILKTIFINGCIHYQMKIIYNYQTQVVMGCLDCFDYQTPVQFIPQKWQQGLGEFCVSCKNKIISTECVSLCKCYLFCHQSCFLRQYSPYMKKEDKLICVRCGEDVKLVLPSMTRFECSKSPLFIGSLALSVSSIIVIIVLAAIGLFQPQISKGAIAAIIIVLSLILIFGTIYSMRKKYINIEQARVVNSNILGNPESSNNMKKQGKDYSEDLKMNKNGGVSSKDLNFEIV